MHDKQNPGIIDLIEEKSLCHFKKGDLLIEQGKKINSLLYLENGTAKIVHKNAKGKEFNFLQVNPGDYIGIHSLLSREDSFVSVIASEPVTALRINGPDLSEAMQKQALLSLEVMKQLCSKIGMVESRITKLGGNNIRQQVAEIILANDLTQPGSKGPYSIQELASLVGTTNNYIYKILAELQHTNIVSVKNKKVMIVDRDKLQHFMEHSGAYSNGQ